MKTYIQYMRVNTIRTWYQIDASPVYLIYGGKYVLLYHCLRRKPLFQINVDEPFQSLLVILFKNLTSLYVKRLKAVGLLYNSVSRVCLSTKYVFLALFLYLFQVRKTINRVRDYYKEFNVYKVYLFTKSQKNAH